MDDIQYQKMLKDVASYTKSNNNTEARIVIAKFFGLNTQLGQLQSIAATHDRQGYMTADQISKRSKITKTMMNLIVAKYQSEIIMKEIYSKL